jgi:hypothetical protein
MCSRFQMCVCALCDASTVTESFINAVPGFYLSFIRWYTTVLSWETILIKSKKIILPGGTVGKREFQIRKYFTIKRPRSVASQLGFHLPWLRDMGCFPVILPRCSNNSYPAPEQSAKEVQCAKAASCWRVSNLINQSIGSRRWDACVISGFATNTRE